VENVTSAVLRSKFTRDTMYQLKSESVEFCRRYDRNILLYFYLDKVYTQIKYQTHTVIYKLYKYES